MERYEVWAIAKSSIDVNTCRGEFATRNAALVLIDELQALGQCAEIQLYNGQSMIATYYSKKEL